MVKCDQQKSTNIYILRGREYMLTDILSPTALLLAQGVCAEDICVLAFTSRPNDSIRTSTIGHRPPRSLCSPRIRHNPDSYMLSAYHGCLVSRRCDSTSCCKWQHELPCEYVTPQYDRMESCRPHWASFVL